MARVRIEVVYALPGGEDAVTLELDPGATALDAVLASGLAEGHAPLRDGDRVELYRPLVVDAKEARRRRALRKS
jgi:putative ubiquitin-RnfH superfamily antitoxin RatB of RatAB toxin-antitoxin module